jgi:DNA-directed RNA polymerase specialized sigma24 family protein
MSTVQSDLSGALQEHWEGVVAQLHADLRRIASREECEDAVQDAIAAALARNDERPLHNPGGWLLLVGRRRALDAWRRRTGRHRDSAQRRRPEPIDGTAARDLGALDADLLALLDAPGSEATETFGALADDHRRILSLRLEGMSVREIAQAIGASSEKAAERRLARAWEALRRLFIATERDPDSVSLYTSDAADE